MRFGNIAFLLLKLEKGFYLQLCDINYEIEIHFGYIYVSFIPFSSSVEVSYLKIEPLSLPCSHPLPLAIATFLLIINL